MQYHQLEPSYLSCEPSHLGGIDDGANILVGAGRSSATQRGEGYE